MMRLRPRLVIRTVAALTVLLLLGPGIVDGHSPAASSMMQRGMMLERLAGQQLEIVFLGAMIPHHEAAVEMARLARSRAERAEVRSAAEEIITTQQEEIETMTSWLKTWYGLYPGEAMHRMSRVAGMDQMMKQMEGSNEKMIDSLEALRGEAFDHAFLEMMISHHRSAIAMAQPITKKAVRGKLHALAHSIIRSQGQEIAQFQRWLRTW